MKREDIRKLLGGYATGTLTEQERRTLFEEALRDQEIFDALAGEEPLKQLLAEPAFRRELVAELASQPPGSSEKLAAWWRQPRAIAAATVVALALAVGLFVFYPRLQREPPVEIAQQRAPGRAPSLGKEEMPAPAGAKPVEKKAQANVPEAEPQSPRRKAAPPAQTEQTRAAASRGDLTAPSSPTASQPAPARRRMAAAVRERREVAPAISSLAMGEAASEPALGCQLEKESPGGAFVPLESGQTVTMRDRVRLRVLVPEPGMVYLLESRGGTRERLIYSGRVSSAGWVAVPADAPLAPPPEPGQRRLTVVYSRDPISEAAARSIAAGGAGKSTAVVTVRYR